MIAKDVRQFLDRLEGTLRALAREGRHVELENRFHDFQKLIGAWLDVAPKDTAPPERIKIFTIIDRFGGPFEIDVWAIAREASLSKDSSTVDVVAEQLLRSAFTCLNRQQPKLMETVLDALVYLYYQCVSNENIAKALGSQLDRALFNLFSTLRSITPNIDGAKPQSIESERPYLDALLRFALKLLYAAIRHKQAQHASYFMERLFDHREHRPLRHRLHRPTEGDVETLFDYVAVILVGWSLHVLQNSVCDDSRAAQGVLNAGKAQLPSPATLIAEWEFFHAADRLESDIDRRLGIGWTWDIRDWNREFRPGVGEARSGGVNWRKLGLRAGLLLSQQRDWHDLSNVFEGPPNRFIWNPTEEREALENLAADKWVNIPADKRQERIEMVAKIIEERAKNADAQYLQSVLESPLSDKKVGELKDEAIKAYRDCETWCEALSSFGVQPTADRTPLRTRWGIWAPREALLDDSSWGRGFGLELGKQFADREAMAIIHLLELTAPSYSELEELDRLPDVVRATRRDLIDAGYKPTVLILPDEDRFAEALFRKRPWEVERKEEFGKASIGVWEQLDVLRFPYINPTTILLIDTQRAIAEIGEDDAGLRMRFIVDEEPDDETVENKKKAAVALQSSEQPLPSSSSIQVLVRIDAPPLLGISNRDAVRAIGIMKSDGAYALEEESDVYHRSSCPRIQSTKVKNVLRLSSESQRKPCPICKPED